MFDLFPVINCYRLLLVFVTDRFLLPVKQEGPRLNRTKEGCMNERLSLNDPLNFLSL